MGSFSVIHWAIFGSIVLILIGLYFVPIIIAASRKHPQVVWIALTNIFLGWSGIAWIGALVWSLLPITPRQTGMTDG